MGQVASSIQNFHNSNGKPEHSLTNSSRTQFNPQSQAGIDRDGFLVLPDMSPQNLSNPIKYFDITNNANLVIKLTTPSEEVVNYTISRKTLSSASPVFAKLVDKDSRMPSVKKRKHLHTTISWCLDLYDDEWDVMLILLRAIHGQKSLVPARVSYEQLLAMAHLVDKYDCVSVVSEWKELWVKGVQQLRMAKEVMESGGEGWLFICMVFGDSRHFYALTEALILEIHPRCKDGDMIKRKGGDKQICVEDLPNKVYDDIMCARDFQAWKLRSIAKEYIVKMQEMKQPAAKNAPPILTSPMKSTKTNTGKSSKKKISKTPTTKHGKSNNDANPTMASTMTIEAVTTTKLRLNCSCTTSSYSSFMLQCKTEQIWRFLFLNEMEGGTQVEMPDICIVELRDRLLRCLKKAMLFTGMCLRTRKKCNLKEFIGERVEKVENSLDDVKGFEASGYIQ